MTNRLNTKKGMTAQLGLLIIILISAIVIFMFITKFTSKSTFEQAITTCRMSVIAQYATEIAPTISGKKSPFDINCERRYIQFYNNRVELGLSLENMKPLPIRLEGKKLTKFNLLNDFVVNQVIAEELRICKFQFGDGKIEVFGNDENFLSSMAVCFACSEISFDPKITKQQFNTLVEYTEKTKFGDTNETYYEYLTAKNLKNKPLWNQAKEDLTLDTSKKYFIIFKKFENAAVDIYTDGYWIMLIPQEDINKYCDIQAS